MDRIPQDHDESRAKVFPDQVGEGSVQVHGGRGAAEHGQDALQVQELQLLLVINGGLQLLTQNSKHRDKVITEGLNCRPFKQKRLQALDISRGH